MKTTKKSSFKITILLSLILMSITSVYSQSLWDLANKQKNVLVMSVWFTAQDVNDMLSRTAGMDSAVVWCKQNGVTKVYLEAFGRGAYAKKDLLINAKNRFQKEGMGVASGITPTEFKKKSTGKGFNSECYTNLGTQEELQKMVEYTAAIFDEIIFDDWYFTECQCDECVAARGDQPFPKYYGDLMTKVSQERVVKPAHAINPKVKVIIKFPQWYDEFHKRGYEVLREPKIFDGTWAGTESRDFVPGKTPGYEIGYNAYFNMRWVASLQKPGYLGGGWFDASRASSETFVEQARHTVLGNGKEIILWCYSRMIKEKHLIAFPVTSMKALNKEIPGLMELAKIVRDKPIKGVHLLKPGNSVPYDETWACSFVGNLGIPFVPAHDLDENAKAALFPVHAFTDPNFSAELKRMLDKGTPVVITDGLASKLNDPELLKNKNLSILKVNGDSKSLLNMTREEIKPLRDKLLAPFGIQFDAPNKVELYFFGEDYFVVENINNEAIDVALVLPKISSARKALVLPQEGGRVSLTLSKKTVKIKMSPRSLVAVQYR